MSTCCICRKELDMFRFSMPFSGEYEQFLLCRDCYAAKLALDNSEAAKYLEARAYFFKYMENGSVFQDMQPILEAYLKDRDTQNESVIMDYEIGKKFDAYANGSGEALQEMLKTFLLTTGNSFEGYRIKRYITLVSGETALGTGMFSEWAINLAEMSGNESSEIEKKLMEAKRSAQSKLVRRAIGCGANAVLGIGFDVTALTSGLIAVSVNGTAVEVEKIEK